MIKILKHGKKIYTIECKNCGCLFQFNDEDIKHEHSGYNGSYVSIKCPDCGNRITNYDPKSWLKKVLNE